MSKFNVYGIGNALVDYEFKVSDEDLKKLSVDKGLMTLVDEERQSHLLDSLHQAKPDRACGGSAANTMIAVSQLGGQAFYSCKVASDESGDFYAQDLKRNGVESSIEKIGRKDGVTGKCFVMVTPDAERSMSTFLGITETFSEEEIIKDELSKSEYLYMEGYLVTSPTGRVAAVKARKLAESSNVKTALTFSDPNMLEFFSEGMIEMLGENGVDLLFCNEAEALKFAKTEDLEEAKVAIKAVAKSFVITLGAKGSYVFDGRYEALVPAFETSAIDSNGAGDIFAGTFLYGLTNGFSFEQSAMISNYAASLLVNKFGPRLDTKGVEKLASYVRGMRS